MPWLALLFAAADGDDGPAAAVRKGLRFDAVPSLVAFGGHDGGVFAREVRMDGGRGARRWRIPVHGGEARGAGARCGQRGRNGGLAGQGERAHAVRGGCARNRFHAHPLPASVPRPPPAAATAPARLRPWLLACHSQPSPPPATRRHPLLTRPLPATRSRSPPPASRRRRLLASPPPAVFTERERGREKQVLIGGPPPFFICFC